MPIAIDMTRRRVLMVGGGNVCAHKLKALLGFTREITVCAPEIIEGVAAQQGLTLWHRPYDVSMLEGFDVVYACTDDRAVNQQVRRDCVERKILVCVADDPKSCDFISPALYRKGPMSVAVSSNGTDVKRSLRWRKRIQSLFENDSADRI